MRLRTRDVLLGALAFSAACGGASAAPKLKTLYSFCAQANCTDGSGPRTGLLKDASGNLFGTTVGGGANARGTVFELENKQGKYTFRSLYSFCSKAGCADGDYPLGDLIQDTSGKLYGTTYRGGSGLDNGLVYMLKPNKKHTKWSFVALYNFCARENCSDGQHPISGLTYQGALSGMPYDGTSPLFGTTHDGGNLSRDGVAFQLSSNGKTRRTEKIIYEFCDQPNCIDGAFPGGALIVDGLGQVDGVAVNGGATGTGIVYSLSLKQGQSTQRTLYSFCQLANCADGQYPLGAVTLDGIAQFFGTTQQGGTGASNGAIFRLSPQGLNYKETLLYTFCAKAACADGALPNGTLVVDSGDNLFGTVMSGGATNNGAVFKLHETNESVLYSFCSLAGCADGSSPVGGLVLDASGNIYGTTFGGGLGPVAGTVFELTP